MNRTTLLFIVTLLILGAIVYFTDLRPSNNEREVSDKIAAVTVTIDSASVTKVDIDRATKSLTLENVGGKWMLTVPVRAIADPSAVTQMIGSLSKFKAGSLISSNPQKQSLFQVDSSGTRLVVTDRSGKATTLIIGKTGPSFSEVYFRLDGSNDVYLGDGLDSWMMTKEVKDWRDKSIISVPNETLKDISITMNGKQTNFHRDSTTWKSGDRVIETGAMNPLLSTVSSLKAEDFVDTSMKFSGYPTSIMLRGQDNISLTMYPASGDSSKYYIQSSQSPQIFVVGKYTAQQLLKPVEPNLPSKAPSLASKKEEPAPAPKKVVETPSPSHATSTARKEPAKVEQKKTAPATVSAEHENKKEPVKPPVVTKQEPSTEPPKPVTTEKKTESNVPSNNKSRGKKSTTFTQSPTTSDDEGDLTVVTVKKNETMQSIAKKYNVTVEQILKWNLLKSIIVKPGQELYIYVKK